MYANDTLICERCGRQAPEVIVYQTLDPFMKDVHNMERECELCELCDECYATIAEDI